MDEPTRYRAYLCCGPRCTLRRSNPLVDVLARVVARAGLTDQVAVLPGGCMKHCESGPTLTVWPGPVYYEGVTAERLRVIVARHFGQDAPVEEYFWHDPFENARDRARAHPVSRTPAQEAQTRPPLLALQRGRGGRLQVVRRCAPAKIPTNSGAEKVGNGPQSSAVSDTIGTEEPGSLRSGAIQGHGTPTPGLKPPAVPDGLRPGWLASQPGRRTNRSIHKESNDGSEQQQ
jgi:(2Fe-2S) ferredoxin